MKKTLLLTTLMALLVGNALAQGGYTIKAGGTYASFRGQESERDLGLTLGLARVGNLEENGAGFGADVHNQEGNTSKQDGG